MNRRSTIFAFLGLGIAAFTAPAPVYARDLPRAETCQHVGQPFFKNLFVEWNNGLKDPTAKQVVALYSSDATLLPTVENGPYKKGKGLENYFVHFIERSPVATIDESARTITIGCNVAYDIGLYSFQLSSPSETVKARYTFVYKFDGHVWRIAHHHSSKEPQP